MRSSLRLRVSRTHRFLGLVALIPLAGWIVSSFVLHGVGLAAPNGLQGVYELAPFHGADVALEEPGFLPPDSVLRRLAADGLERIYWLRLEQVAGTPAYVVKPGPFRMERVYDARSGARLDPLSEDALRRVADAELIGTRATSLHPNDEFNRYYTLDRVPAVAVEMEGEQPTELVLSRASGRTLRRTDPLAAAFEKAYRSVHVWQWGPSVLFFTAVLYGLVAVTSAVVFLGYVLWFDRRGRRARWTDEVRPARRLHARLAPVAGVVLVSQMFVGAYLWFNLGPIEPRFRGQGSFRTEWQGGIPTQASLPAPAEIKALLPAGTAEGPRPIQRYEWRVVGTDPVWLAYPERDGLPLLVDGVSRRAVARLEPDQAARAAAMVVLGEPTGDAEESTEYWMDANARVPTYRFRFSDPDATDVHVSQHTGEVIQRRPAIWRAFGPFLVYHTFGFTGNPWLDTLLLTALQALVLAMMVSGWRLSRKRPRDGLT